MFRFTCLFLCAVLATLKIWVSTRAMALQSTLTKLEKQQEQLHVESNRLLLSKTQMINRKLLKTRAAELGFVEPDQVLYVIQP